MTDAGTWDAHLFVGGGLAVALYEPDVSVIRVGDARSLGQRFQPGDVFASDERCSSDVIEHGYDRS